MHLVPAGVLGSLDSHLTGGHMLDGSARLLDHGHVFFSHRKVYGRSPICQG
jgi:hypothetical protein